MAKMVNHERMVVSVFKVIFAVIIVALIVFWILGGGIGKIIATARSFHFTSFSDLLTASSTDSLSQFRLPWQPEMPQISVQGVGEQQNTSAGAPQVPSHAFANASPQAGSVHIALASARTQSAAGQYIELDAAGGTGAPIDISGWSLESALSGAQARIPQAALIFVQGQINAVADVRLAPGGRVLVSTGPSPVGVSFRESSCTGYLGTLQPFVPALPLQCPLPLTAVPDSAENQATLGATCFDYLRTLPACTFPSNPSSGLSSACRTRIQTALSYNGCVAQYRHEPSFASDSWRLYLAEGTPLWNGQHDVIRLLDAEGRVVDVVNY